MSCYQKKATCDARLIIAFWTRGWTHCRWSLSDDRTAIQSPAINWPRSIIQQTMFGGWNWDEKDLMESYWQAGITLPLFQMAQRFWPFQTRGRVKAWPLCSASRSHCVWVRVFRGVSNRAFLNSPPPRLEKANLNVLDTAGGLLLIWRLQVFLWSRLPEDKCSPGSFGIIIPHSPTTPTKNMLMFIPDIFPHLFFSHEGTPPPFQFVSEPWEEKRDNDGAAPASFQRAKVSLLARWLVHSADVTWSLSRRSHLPRLLLQGRLLFCLLGPAWLAPSRLRYPPSSPASSVLWAHPVWAGTAHKGRLKGEGVTSLEWGKVIDVAPFWTCFWTVTSKVKTHVLMMSFPNWGNKSVQISQES